MIKDISKVSDLPVQTVAEYRKYGWTDEEIVENLNDAISFLNSNLHCEDWAAIISPRIVFSHRANMADPTDCLMLRDAAR